MVHSILLWHNKNIKIYSCGRLSDAEDQKGRYDSLVQ